jgi:hypothetical protein
VAQADAALLLQIAYIDGTYRTLLGREADPASLIFWVRPLRAGVPRAGLVRELWVHGDHRSQQVETYYQAFLRRAAGADGLACWNGALAAGASETDVAVAILARAILLSDKANSRALDQIFGSYLHRALSDGEQAFWLGQMRAGLPPQQVSPAVLTSDEFYNLTRR